MTEPQLAADLARQLVRQVGRGMGRADVGRALDQLLSPPQRELCQVVSFRGGKLLVEVDSAPLFGELSGFRREELRLGLNALLPTKVAQLSFRLGGTGHV